MILLRQVHSNVVVVADPGKDVPCEGDGLITGQAGILIGVRNRPSAPPCWWRTPNSASSPRFTPAGGGTAKRIVEKGIGRMRADFGCQPENLIAAIGAGVGVCCYEVGEELVTGFKYQISCNMYRGIRSRGAPKQRYRRRIRCHSSRPTTWTSRKPTVVSCSMPA